MIERIESKKPLYDRKAWINDRVQNLVYLQNIATYPEIYIEPKREMKILEKKRKEEEGNKVPPLRRRFLAPVQTEDEKKGRSVPRMMKKEKTVPEIPKGSELLKREMSATGAIGEVIKV